MVCGRRNVFRPGTPVFAGSLRLAMAATGSLSVAGRMVVVMEMSTEGAAESVSPVALPSAPASLSPSRASDFMQCPLLYRFRVIDRLPEKPSEAATRGTLVHAVLERLFDAPAAERTAPRAKSLIPGQWDRLLETQAGGGGAVRGRSGGRAAGAVAG